MKTLLPVLFLLCGASFAQTSATLEPGFMDQYGWGVYLVVFILAVILLWALWLYPVWKVWASHKDGQADLQRAKNEQQIQIAQAQSRLDAASLNKEAAIIEAQAVAAQINEIGKQLTEHDLYLKWQWIKMMEDRHDKSSTIYVPTEANIPIMEASRLTSDKL